MELKNQQEEKGAWGDGAGVGHSRPWGGTWRRQEGWQGTWPKPAHSAGTVTSWGCGGGIWGCDDTVLPTALFLPPPPLLHEKPIHSLGLPSSTVCWVLAFLRVITCFLKVDILGVGGVAPKFSYLLPRSQPGLGTMALSQKLEQAFP